MNSAEDLVQKYQNMLYRAALSITRNPDDALDMVQDTFIQWLTKRPVFESDEHEKAWLLRVVINASKNLVTCKAHTSGEELLDIYPAKNEEEYELLDSVGRLPPNYRAVIHLFYYEGCSTAEAARILEQKESTVRSWLTRARSMLRRELEEETHA